MNRTKLLLTIGACLAASLPVWAQYDASDGSGRLRFTIDGTTRAEVLSTGYVSATGIQFSDGTSLTTVTDAADNLGDHTATENIQLNGNYLSGDGGDEGIFVTSAGLVGVGTDSPSDTVHVYAGASSSQIFLQGNTSYLDLLRTSYTPNSGGLRIGVGSSNQHEIKTLSAVPLRLGTNNTERVRIDASGNVGIGTSIPDVSLTIEIPEESGAIARFKADGHTGIELGVDASGVNHQYGVLSFYGDPDSGISRGIGGVISATTGKLRYQANDAIMVFDTNVNGSASTLNNLYSFNTNDSAVMVVDKDGELGLGTTSPTAIVDAYGTISATGLQISGTGYLDTLYVGGSAVTGGDPTSIANGTSSITVAGSSSITFDVAGSRAVTIGENGYVGVGTSNPVRGMLHIKQSGSTYLDGLAVESPGDDTFFSIRGDGTKYIIEPTYSSTGSYQPLNFRTSGLDRMVLDTSGNVGIGTTSPSSTLHVAGSVSVTDGFSVGDKALYVDGSTGKIGFGTDTPIYPFEVHTTATTLAMFKNTSNLHAFMFKTNSLGSELSSGNINHYLAFGLGNTEKLRIEAGTGNVGISNTNPNAKLDVVGTVSATGLQISGTGYLDTLYVGGSAVTGGDPTSIANGTSSITVAGSSSITFDVAGSRAVTIGENGYLGIGTDSPSEKLHITQGSGETFFEGNLGRGLKVGTPTNSNVTAYFDIYNGLVGNRYLDFRGEGTSRMVIQASGNVGIGTTSPSSTFHILNGSSHHRLDGSSFYQYSANASTPRIRLGSSNIPPGYPGLALSHEAWGDIPAQGVGLGIVSAKTLGLFTSNGTALTERMRINGSGNVGIGTTAPNAKLDVVGTVSATGLQVSGTGYLDTLYVGGSAVTGGDPTSIANGTSSITVAGSSSITFDVAGSRKLELNENMVIVEEDLGASPTEWQSQLYVKTPSSNGNLVRIGLGEGDALKSQIESGRESTSTDGYISFKTRNASTDMDEHLRITSSGNVGIGTISPSSTLHVVGDVQITTADPYTGNILITSPAAPSRDYHKMTTNPYIQYYDYGGANSALQFRANDGAINTLNLADGGEVGIGITSPNAKLDVAGTISATGLQISGTGYLDTLYVGGSAVTGGDPTALGSGVTSITLSDQSIDFTVSNTASISFGPYNTQNYPEISTPKYGLKMTTSKGYMEYNGTFKFTDNLVPNNGYSGNIHLGTPGNYELTNAWGDVLARTFRAPNVSIDRDQPVDDLTIRGGNAGAISTGSNQSGGDVFIYGGSPISSGTSGSVILAHNGSIAVGNVGIGTDSPNAKLEVAGTVSATGISVTGDIYFTGDIWDISDRRAKTNIQPEPHGLETILSLNPVTFEMKNALGQTEHGFIAQEVEKLLPELVGGDLNDPESFRSLNYNGLIAPLVRAVQEQQAQIKQLEAENTSLRAANDNRLQALEAANDNQAKEIEALRAEIRAFAATR